MYDILKVSGSVFETVSGLKVHVIYCITILAVIIYRLRLCMANLSINESMNESVLTCNVDNSGVLALLSCLGKLAVSLFCGPRYKELFFGLINVQNVFIMKLHGLRILSGYLKNIQGGDTSCNRSRFHNFSQRYVDMWFCYLRRYRKYLL
jgi:hypothetical protein